MNRAIHQEPRRDLTSQAHEARAFRQIRKRLAIVPRLRAPRFEIANVYGGAAFHTQPDRQQTARVVRLGTELAGDGIEHVFRTLDVAQRAGIGVAGLHRYRGLVQHGDQQLSAAQRGRVDDAPKGLEALGLPARSRIGVRHRSQGEAA